MVDQYSIAPKQADTEENVQELNESMEQRVSERTSKLEKITSQSHTIEQQEHETELKKSLERERLIRHLIQLMNRSFDVDIILEIVAREIGTFFSVDRCLVIYYERESEEVIRLRLSAQYCRSKEIEPIRGGEVPLEMLTLLQTQPAKDSFLILLSDPDVPPPIKKHLERHNVQSALIIEIKYRRFAFGRFVLHQCNHFRTWSKQDTDFLKILAKHIGSALYQAKLFQEQKQAKQEAEEANRQKSKILSYVSHDFKNPLDSIKRFLSVLEKDQDTVLPEKHRQMIGYIAEGIHQLRNMVTDILDKARLEEGRIMPSPEWIDLISFIDELRPMFQAMAAPRNIEVNIEIQPELAAVKADPTHLRQILINLLNNAVKYNRAEGNVLLKLCKSQDGQFIVIEVQDTGLGIPAEKMSQLFTEYFRVDLSQANQVEGSGLGLAFIKKLIELSGGTINVESIQGKGSTFTVYLPSPVEPELTSNEAV